MRRRRRKRWKSIIKGKGIEEYEDIAQFRKAHVIKSEREGVYCTSI